MLGLLREKKGLEPEGPEELRQHIGLDPDVVGSRMAEDRLDMGEAVDMEHFPRIQDLTPCPGPQETVAAWRKQWPPLREGIPDLPQRTSEGGSKGSDEQSRLSGSTTKGQETPMTTFHGTAQGTLFTDVRRNVLVRRGHASETPRGSSSVGQPGNTAHIPRHIHLVYRVTQKDLTSGLCRSFRRR